jgi:hypothetical protein
MKAFRTISAVMLALLVLFSSTSFMIGMHFCMGEVQNIALFTKADVCEKEQSMPPCHRHMKVPCCEDKTVVHKGDDFKASLASLQILAPAAIDIEQPSILISEIIPSAPVSRIQYYQYDPPLRSCDLTVEHQVFLI